MKTSHVVFPLESGALRFVVVADTHSKPHPDLGKHIDAIAPNRILHAGDIGDPAVLRELARHAPVTAVRGNIDPVSWRPAFGGSANDELGEPDVVVLDVREGERTLLRILMTHVAVSGSRLRADVLRLAKQENASLVVCGHSHVPFVSHDRGVPVFNPGSAGPRRFHLPILFGVLEITPGGVTIRHVDCETGETWRPPS